MPLKKYLDYARASANYAWDHYDEIINKWKQRFDPNSVFGFRPPGGLLETAEIYSYLYQKENLHKYTERAKKILLTYGDFRSIYPQDSILRRPDYSEGVPVLPDFFTVMRYIRAYDMLNHKAMFTSKEKHLIEGTIADSIDDLLRTQEWGSMNRAALRAESLAWAIKAVPEHPGRRIWKMQRKAIGDDNWGSWEIEDATIYHGVWLYALCGYAHALDKMEDLFNLNDSRVEVAADARHRA